MVERDLNQQIQELRKHQEYRHCHKGLKALDRHIKAIRKLFVINYHRIRTVNGYEYVNVGVVLVNREIMERLI